MFVYDELKNTMETERLLLRRFKSDDASKVAVICNTDEVYKGTLALPHPYTEESAICWISHHDENFEKNLYYDYAITDKYTGELYGCIGIGVDLNSNMGEIGYWVDPNHWNKGIATEAAKAIIKYGFEVKKFHKINARFFTYNPASGRVMEKAGMQKEGLQKKHVWKLDRYEDIILYGIVNPNEEE